jgi:hypothetical protein
VDLLALRGKSGEARQIGRKLVSGPGRVKPDREFVVFSKFNGLRVLQWLARHSVFAYV